MNVFVRYYAVLHKLDLVKLHMNEVGELIELGGRGKTSPEQRMN